MSIYIYLFNFLLDLPPSPCDQFHQTTRYNKTIIDSNHSHRLFTPHFPEQHSVFRPQRCPKATQHRPAIEQISVQQLEFRVQACPLLRYMRKRLLRRRNHTFQCSNQNSEYNQDLWQYMEQWASTSWTICLGLQ